MRAIWPGALLVVYLAGTGALLIAGRDRVGLPDATIHMAVLLALAAVTWSPAVPRWLRAWAPLLLLLFLYSELPALIRAAGHVAWFDAVVIRWEDALFGMQPARAWAQAPNSPAASEILHLAYLSYYAIIYVVPAELWLAGRRDDFAAAVFTLMLTFVACFVCYIAFPVLGPRYAWSAPVPEGIFRSAATVLLEARSSAGTAFPSSHVAVSVAQSILAVRFLGARGGIVGVLTCGLAFGAIYGGFHYAVDVVAGAALGVITAVLGLRFVRPDSPSQANATAPTYPTSER